MKENQKRKDYLQPDVAILSIDGESHLLVESPLVRPGGGGSGSQTPGAIIVVPHISDDENSDDDIEG